MLDNGCNVFRGAAQSGKEGAQGERAEPPASGPALAAQEAARVAA